MTKENKVILITTIVCAVIVAGCIFISEYSLRKKKIHQERMEKLHEVIMNTDPYDYVIKYDSVYSIEHDGYHITIIEDIKHDYVRLNYSSQKQKDRKQVYDRFAVNVCPGGCEFEKYKDDIVDRFIAVHEEEKRLFYEYTVSPTGTLVEHQIHPLTREFNVSIAHRCYNGKIQDTYLRRNRTGDIMRLTPTQVVTHPDGSQVKHY